MKTHHNQSSYSKMSRRILKAFCLLLLAAYSSAQLSPNFYAATCPNALFTIKFAVLAAVAREPRMGASLLRLHFHDCFVNGCDGSVLLDDTATFQGEKNALPNKNSLRGFEVIDSIKSSLERICPGVVSCADILAVAARDSVVTLGGPSWNVALGRRDSRTASFDAVLQSLVTPFADLPELISKFAANGFSARELVALYGAHTFGQAKCATFRNRIYNEANIDPTFAASLQAQCPASGGDGNLVPLDGMSPVIFDTAWFLGLINRKGLLHADQQLYSGGATDQYVNEYSLNIFSFRNDFTAGMLKMSNLSPLTGASGEIRTNCRFVN